MPVTLPAEAPSGDAVDVTLVTEGTYPFAIGGVSVWCDGLLRALPGHRFHVLALTATGHEKRNWQLPPNVVALEPVALWGERPRGKVGRTMRREFLPVLQRFFASLDVQGEGLDFTASLRGLWELAHEGLLAPLLGSRQAVEALVESAPTVVRRDHGEDPGAMSVADATAVVSQLEHFLRPLAVSPRASDLYHAVANGLGALPALAAKWSLGTPFLLTEHGIYLRERYLAARPGTASASARALLLRFFKLLVQTGYEHADVIAPCCSYNSQWELACGTDRGRIEPVLNGIDPARFPEVTGEPEVPTLSWIGRVDPLKDLETLLRAFALVHEVIPESRLRLFGPTPEGNEAYHERCVRLSGQLGVAPAVTFEGPSAPLDAYRAGHVVVLSSISEAFPYTVLEAMAAGRPVVATDVGGVAEAVGDAGLLVTPRDPPALAAACLRLLGDKAQRQALGGIARLRVLSRFTADRSFGAYGSIYGRLGDGRPLGRVGGASSIDLTEDLLARTGAREELRA